VLKARQKLGKYRILGRIASGPQADVYKAYDTIHNTRVALKLPNVEGPNGLDDVLHEVRVAARLHHPNILAIQNASYIDNHFVIAMELGVESLGDRLERRISVARAMSIADLLLLIFLGFVGAYSSMWTEKFFYLGIVDCGCYG